MTTLSSQKRPVAVAFLLVAIPIVASCHRLPTQALPTGAPPIVGCYALLEPQNPELEGASHPVCGAVVAYLDASCDSVPLRKFDLSRPVVDELSRPNWQALDTVSHQELVKQTYLASTLPAYRDGVWRDGAKAIHQSITAGTLHLWRADLDDALNGALQTVYKLENASIDNQSFDQSWTRIMFSERGSEVPSQLLSPLSYVGTGDLVHSQSAWYLLDKHIDDKEMLEVKELARFQSATDSPVATITRCRIQHKNDREGGK